jgi:hypothetical protein
LVLTGLVLAAAALPARADTTTVYIYAPASARTFYAITPRPASEGPSIVTIFIKPTNRYLNAERALFQNWTGFRKQYSGRQYPF